MLEEPAEPLLADNFLHSYLPFHRGRGTSGRHVGHGLVRPTSVIVAFILAQEQPQVLLAEDDEVIQALAPN
jgi:hypothetical protein